MVFPSSLTETTCFSEWSTVVAGSTAESVSTEALSGVSVAAEVETSSACTPVAPIARMVVPKRTEAAPKLYFLIEKRCESFLPISQISFYIFLTPKV